MTGEGLQCAVQFARAPRDFYTNGETIRGSLVLRAAHRTKLVSKVTGSLICEEWVHTTQLEYKEHYHSNSKVFNVARNPIEVRPGHAATVSFELTLPHDDDLRLPPSFDLKHNSVVWKTKFLVEHREHEAADVGIAQAEQPFRLCRFSQKHEPDLADASLNTYERHAGAGDFVLARGVVNKGETALHDLMQPVMRVAGRHSPRPVEVKDLKDVELDLKLGVPAHGLVQTPRDDGPTLGLRLSIAAQHNGLELREIALDIIKCVVTAGQDPYEEVKPVTRVREVSAVNAGTNEVGRCLARVRLSGLTETFQSEWQQLSQRLRITLSFTKDGDNGKHVIKLPWEVPVTILSEAYGCC